MADISVGLSDAEILRTLAQLEAFGEIMAVPPPQLAAIIAKARGQLEKKPKPPVGP